MDDVNDALEELFTQAEGRGYVLATELAAAEPDGDETWLQDATDDANARGLVVVDDLADADVGAVSPDPQAMADPVRWYLDRAAAHDLLDAEQEMDLAKRYQAGLAAAELLAGDAPGAGSRAQLQRLVADGERAKQAMIAHNLRLVVPTAKRYAGHDLDLLESIQEANVGLMRAVEKFDHTKGYKFSTYAVWWIRQAAQRGLSSQARTIRVPVSVWEDRAKVRKTGEHLRARIGREATDEELAAETGLSVKRIRDVHEALRPLSSLDKPVGESQDTPFGDLLPDQEASDPAQLATVTDAHQRLAAVLGALEPRQRRIVELRFGFEDGRTWTYDEIAADVGLTRERVRQLTHQATEELRNGADAAGLRTLHEVLAA